MMGLQWRRKVCPRCGEPNTRPSTRRKPIDYFLRVILLFPYRCHTCGERFWRFV